MDETREQPSGLPPYEVALRITRDVDDGIRWARARKRRFRRASSLIKALTLVLSAGSTVILGLQDLNPWAGVAFSLVAVTTVVNAVEPFFNWRSRWVLMEDAQYRLQRIHDELAYLLMKTPPEAVRIDEVDEFFVRLQGVWDDTSQRWLEHRRGDQAGAGAA